MKSVPLMRCEQSMVGKIYRKDKSIKIISHIKWDKGEEDWLAYKAGGVKQEVDFRDKVMNIEMSDLWFSKRVRLEVEQWWRQSREYWEQVEWKEIKLLDVRTLCTRESSL